MNLAMIAENAKCRVDKHELRLFVLAKGMTILLAVLLQNISSNEYRFT